MYQWERYDSRKTVASTEGSLNNLLSSSQSMVSGHGQQHPLGTCFRPPSRHSESGSLEGELRNLRLMSPPGDSNAHGSLGTSGFSSITGSSGLSSRVGSMAQHATEGPPPSLPLLPHLCGKLSSSLEQEVL